MRMTASAGPYGCLPTRLGPHIGSKRVPFTAPRFAPQAVAKPRAIAAPHKAAAFPLGYFLGNWKLTGGDWRGTLEVIPVLSCWVQSTLRVVHENGQAREVHMRDSYDASLGSFMRRKEADNGAYFDYKSAGWDANHRVWTWEGTGHNFYGKQQGGVRSTCERLDDHRYRVTDAIECDGRWQQTYQLTFERLPS